MAKVIIAEKLIDEEFVTRSTDNFTNFAKSLEAYIPENVARLTGVAGDDIKNAVGFFVVVDSQCRRDGGSSTSAETSSGPKRTGGHQANPSGSKSRLAQNVGSRNGADFSISRAPHGNT